MFARILASSRTAVVLLLVALLGVPSFVAPGRAEANTEAELSDVRQYAKELDRRVATAEQELVTIEDELDALAVELDAAAAELEAAEQTYGLASKASEEAAERVAAVEKKLGATQAAQAANNEVLREVARDTYKHGMAASSPQIAMIEFVGDTDADGLSDRIHFLHHSLGERTAALEEAEVLVVQIGTLAGRARDEADEAQRLVQAADDARSATAEVHARFEQIMAETSVKLARQDELVAELEESRAQAAMRIDELEHQLEQERIERERREREERERREREERERREREEQERLERERQEQQRRDHEAAQQREQEEKDRQAREEREREKQRAASSTSSSESNSSGSSSKSSSSASSTSGTGSGSSSSGSKSSGSGGGSGSSGVSSSPAGGGLVTVGGITVAASLAPQLEKLLNAARADGIVLGGSGYRSPEVTARLRRINGCPDVYNSPASSCRVPTAKPGTSEHEKGLAVDFTYQGSTICFPRPGSQCSGNAGFDWLKANAGKYGLKNLSSEAWHWSTTGR